MPTKSEKGGAPLHISKQLIYKNRQDLNINKDEMLESVFIEVLSKSNKNTLIGCVQTTKTGTSRLYPKFHSTSFR